MEPNVCPVAAPPHTELVDTCVVADRKLAKLTVPCPHAKILELSSVTSGNALFMAFATVPGFSRADYAHEYQSRQDKQCGKDAFHPRTVRTRSTASLTPTG